MDIGTKVENLKTKSEVENNKIENNETNLDKIGTKTDNIETNLDKIETKVTDSYEDMQTRLYFRVFGDNIDILYRPTHEYLAFVKKDEEGIKEIKILLSKDRESFKNYLVENKMKRVLKKKERESERYKHLEEWYKKAWSEQTEKLKSELKLDIPIEMGIYEDEILKISRSC